MIVEVIDKMLVAVAAELTPTTGCPHLRDVSTDHFGTCLPCAGEIGVVCARCLDRHFWKRHGTPEAVLCMLCPPELEVPARQWEKYEPVPPAGGFVVAMADGLPPILTPHIGALIWLCQGHAEGLKLEAAAREHQQARQN